jgi:hypothetical protein
VKGKDVITLIKKLKSFFKEKQNPEHVAISEYENKLLLIDKVDSLLFNHFNNKDNSTIVIRTLYPKITTYIHKLKEINGFLGKDKVVFNGWCQEKEAALNACDFFLDTKNQYIDEVKHIEEFKLLTIVFLSFYYEHSLLVEVGEHNTRVLTYFKDSLLNTIEDLTTIVNK